jgi:Flp pilus assembly pilin Flp
MRFTSWFDSFRGRWSPEEGQTMTEYGVVLLVIALGCIVAFTALSGGVSNALNNAAGMFG